MRNWNEPDNPFASFGSEESHDEEEPSVSSPEAVSSSSYDVELTGAWGDFLPQNCVLRTRGDMFFFDSGKKSFECSRSEAYQKSKRIFSGPLFYYRSPYLYIVFSIFSCRRITLAQTDAMILRVAKLIAWSKTLSDDEMKPVVRREITGVAWRWIFVLGWIPLLIALIFSLFEFAVNGWMAALGPLHGASMVFIGYVVASFRSNTRWVSALPTGCLACAVDYFVRFFSVPIANETTDAYLLCACAMLFFAALSFLPFYFNATLQRAFTQELDIARAVEQSMPDD